MAGEVNAYEQARLVRISANKAQLAALGLATGAARASAPLAGAFGCGPASQLPAEALAR